MLGLPLAEDAHTRERIEDYFNHGIRRAPTENNWKQALVPEGAIVVDNHNGTAPGLILKTQDHKLIILLPGPPESFIQCLSRILSLI